MDAAEQKIVRDTVAALQSNDPALKKLKLKNGQDKQIKIGASGCKAICGALERNTSVVEWSHISDDFGEEGARAVARMLELNSCMTKVYFGNKVGGAASFCAIMGALERNKAVVNFGLSSWEGIGVEGARAVQRALERNSTLTNLRITRNAFGPEGVRVISSAMERNSTLTSLDIGGNAFGPEGVRVISSAMERNSTLTSLDIGDSSFGPEGARVISSAMERNSTLTSLNMSFDTTMGVDGARAIGVMLQRNGTLLDLDLAYSFKTAEEALLVVDALERNSALTRLWLQGCQLGVEGGRRVKIILERNTTLRTLILAATDVPKDVEEQCKALCERNRKIAAAKDNKRAKSVIISGATGPNASSINGFFDPTSEIHEDRVRYCKRGDSTVWIEHFKTDNGNHLWQIKRASAKGTHSALMWTYGLCALEACQRNDWFDPEEIVMAGVKLHLQTDAEYKAAEAEADAAEKANYTQTLKLLERLGLQSHIPTFMKEKITDKVAVDMTLEDLKSIGLAFGEAKLLKKELEALASPAAPSLPATTSSLAAAGGGAGAGVPAAGGGAAAVVSSSPPLSSPSLTLDATILSPFISRVMSADDEDLDLRSPIEGLEKQALLTFAEVCAVPSLVAAIPDLPKYAFLATKAGKQKFAKLGPTLGLTVDEFAMVYLYSMECGFYKRLNTELRDRNRAVLVASYFPALRLLLSAINKLPKVNTTVYRGVKKSLLDRYTSQAEIDPNIFWWAFSSTTSSIDVLNNDMFCGTTGERTIFRIRVSSGVDISALSSISGEKEILLLPCCCFDILKVENLHAVAPGLVMIDLEEVDSPFSLTGV